MIQERCTCDICVMMQVQYIYRYSTLLFLQVAVYRTHAAPDWTTGPAIIWLPTVLGPKEANGEQVQVWLVMDGSLSPSDVRCTLPSIISTCIAALAINGFYEPTKQSPKLPNCQRNLGNCQHHGPTPRCFRRRLVPGRELVPCWAFPRSRTLEDQFPRLCRVQVISTATVSP